MARNTPRTREEVLEFIAHKTIFDKATGCVEWTGGKDKNGYGKIHYDGEHWRTHRLLYFLFHGERPVLVQHSCDNPSCCNLKHLSAGTWLTNMQDKVRKGRLRNQYMDATHCIHGHEFSEENTRLNRGRRVCRKCVYETNKRIAERRKQEKQNG